ncbi:MAG: ZIP family metal transporter [bacterium]|nr:ZIP family metal transporter [bacterium]
MVSNLLSVIMYSLIAGLATYLSAQFVIRDKKLSTKKVIYFVSFSAGALFSLAFFHLIPEALDLNPKNALYATVGAFVLFYFLEQQIMMHSCEEEKCSHHHVDKSKGLVGLWGILLHSLIDGALIGIGFEVNFALGLVTALAVLVHKIPDGISVSSIMLHSGFTKKDTSRNSSLVAIATPIGAILAYFLLRGVSNDWIGLALGFSAGTFLYISASDLIPETHENVNWLNGFFVVLGIIAIVFTKILIT